MSKLKLDSRSLTDAMQKNPDFIPTLVNALSSGNVGQATEQLSLADPKDNGLQLADHAAGDNLVSETSLQANSASLAPSELRSSIEQQRMDEMMESALS